MLFRRSTPCTKRVQDVSIPTISAQDYLSSDAPRDLRYVVRQRRFREPYEVRTGYCIRADKTVADEQFCT